MKDLLKKFSVFIIGTVLFAGAALAQDSSSASPMQSTHGATTDSLQGSTRKSIEPDNSGINARDRDSSAATADQQGQSASDIEMTRNIRRAIVDSDSMSTYAKNIKIITKDGMVTLKGPVRSEQEKSMIEAKATALAGAGKIRNELEVKAAEPPKKD